MTKQFLFRFLLLTGISIRAQDNINVDSLKEQLSLAKSDSARFEAVSGIFLFYIDSNTDSAIVYGQKLYQFSLTSKSQQLKARAFHAMGGALWRD